MCSCGRRRPSRYVVVVDIVAGGGVLRLLPLRLRICVGRGYSVISTMLLAESN